MTLAEYLELLVSCEASLENAGRDAWELAKKEGTSAAFEAAQRQERIEISNAWEKIHRLQASYNEWGVYGELRPGPDMG